jgi:hypothetical protein
MKILRSRILWLIFVVAPLLMGSQCGVSAFPSGIRMYAFEAPEEDPQFGIGVGGVLDGGEWISYNSGQSQGTQFSFSGSTNYAGLDDHPFAHDNSLWYVTIDFTAATDGVCGAGSTTASIPLGGRTVTNACLLPPD